MQALTPDSAETSISTYALKPIQVPFGSSAAKVVRYNYKILRDIALRRRNASLPSNQRFHAMDAKQILRQRTASIDCPQRPFDA